MSHIKYTGVDKVRHQAHISHTHQQILEIRNEFKLGGKCAHLPQVYNLNYEELKSIVSSHTSANIKSLESLTLDLNLQMHLLQNCANYYTYNSRVKQGIDDVCQANQMGINGVKQASFLPN